MQPVRKKTSSPSKKILVITAILVLVAAVVSMLWLFLKEPGKKPISPDGTQSAYQQIRLIDLKEGDLAGFEIFPPGHPSYRLVRVEGRFQVEGKPSFILDQDMLENMVKDLTSLEAEKVGTLDEVKGGLAALGLDEGHFRVKASYIDGSTRTLSFGSAAPTDIPSDYLMLSGDDSIYTVSPQIRANLDNPLGALHTIPRIDFTSDLLDTVQVAAAGESFTLMRQDGLWQVTSPVHYPADLAQIGSMLKEISAMRLAVYVGDASELDLSAYDLLTPRRTVTFHLAPSVIIKQGEGGQAASHQQVPEQSMRFSVGKDIDGIGFYCLYKGSVYQTSYASMGLLTALSLEGMLAKRPIIIPINQLDSIQVESSNKSRLYQVELVERILSNNALAKDESGRQIYDPVVSLDGTATDQEAFLKEYLKLMDLGGLGRLKAGYTPEGEPEIKYTLQAEGVRLELAFYPYDALHLAMVVNGHAVYYISRQALSDIAL